MTTLNSSMDCVFVVEPGGEKIVERGDKNITELMREAEEITDNIGKMEEILSDTEEVIEATEDVIGAVIELQKTLHQLNWTHIVVIVLIVTLVYGAKCISNFIF